MTLILKSWRTGTQKQYSVYITKWRLFCTEQGASPFRPSISVVLDFLTSLFHSGIGYSGINTARSALSTVITLEGNIALGSHPLVCRFMKGVGEERPSLPRYTQTWDVQVVLSAFRKQPLVQYISLKDLTLKLTMLIALVTAQRCQTLSLMNTAAMTQSGDKFIFRIDGKFKQARPGFNHLELTLSLYPHDIRVCVYTTLVEYLKRTQTLGGETTALFVSFSKPHRPASPDTIGRWIKTFMAIAGVDVACFKPHSTRAASTSAAARGGCQCRTS
jgi:hypothetical protein